MSIIIKILLDVLIIGLFLYSKLLPYQSRLVGQYKRIFNIGNKIFSPVFNGLKSIVKPVPVGVGLSVDMAQIALLVLLLLINNLIR
jgi:hypothetical protein